VFNSPGGGVPWDDLREILSGCQWMAKVPNAVEKLPKIWTAWVGRTNVTDDRRQTDGRQHIANSTCWLRAAEEARTRAGQQLSLPHSVVLPIPQNKSLSSCNTVGQHRIRNVIKDTCKCNMSNRYITELILYSECSNFFSPQTYWRHASYLSSFR